MVIIPVRANGQISKAPQFILTLTNSIFYQVISVKKTSGRCFSIIVAAVVEYITCQNQDP